MAANAPAYYPYRTPHGLLTIRIGEAGVTDVAFGDVVFPGERRPSELANRTATELLEYFAGKRRMFDVPLAPQGSAFQKTVWNALASVPYGSTCTSATIAQALGKPSSYRSVGAAVKKNPLAVLVPDHRMVGVSGETLGSGPDARLRHALLELEREHLREAE